MPNGETSCLVDSMSRESFRVGPLMMPLLVMRRQKVRANTPVSLEEKGRGNLLCAHWRKAHVKLQCPSLWKVTSRLQERQGAKLANPASAELVQEFAERCGVDFCVKQSGLNDEPFQSSPCPAGKSMTGRRLTNCHSAQSLQAGWLSESLFVSKSIFLIACAPALRVVSAHCYGSTYEGRLREGSASLLRNRAPRALQTVDFWLRFSVHRKKGVCCHGLEVLFQQALCLRAVVDGSVASLGRGETNRSRRTRAGNLPNQVCKVQWPRMAES